MLLTQGQIEKYLKDNKYITSSALSSAVINASGIKPGKQTANQFLNTLPASAWTSDGSGVTFNVPVVVSSNLIVNSNCGNDNAAAACGIFNTGTYYGETGGNGHNSPRIYSPKIMGDGWQAPMIHGGNDNSQVDFPSGIISENAGIFKAGIIVSGPLQHTMSTDARPYSYGLGISWNNGTANTTDNISIAMIGNNKWLDAVSINNSSGVSSSAKVYPYGKNNNFYIGPSKNGYPGIYSNEYGDNMATNYYDMMVTRNFFR